MNCKTCSDSICTQQCQLDITDTNYDNIVSMVIDYREAVALPMRRNERCDDEMHLQLMTQAIRTTHTTPADISHDYAKNLADRAIIATGWRLDAGPARNAWYYQQMGILSALAAAAGINLTGAISIVHRSNMTRPCTAAEVQPTLEHYQAQNLEITFVQTGEHLFSAFCVADNNPHASDYLRVPAGKQLPSINYQKPNWHNVQEWLL